MAGDSKPPRVGGSGPRADDAYQEWLERRTLAALEGLGADVEDVADEDGSGRHRLVVNFAGVSVGGRGSQQERDVRAAPGVMLPALLHGQVDGAALLAAELPPLRVLVPDLIPEGTTIVASPPKVGKSWLMYQLCAETALGGELLGRRVNGGLPGAVLYLALEDAPRRAQDRLRRALRGRGVDPGWLTLAYEAPAMGDGLEEYIAEWLDRHGPGSTYPAALVIVDTLGRARGLGRVGDERRNAYQVDVRDLSVIQSQVLQRGVALVVVHHTAKAGGDDFVRAVSGTYGISGTADTILVLSRKRNEAVGFLDVSSRELREQELAIVHGPLGLWELAPAAAVVRARLSPERQAVYDALAAAAGRPMQPREVTEAMGRDAASPAERNTVLKLLQAMVGAGYVEHVVGGYRLAVGVDASGSDTGIVH